MRDAPTAGARSGWRFYGPYPGASIDSAGMLRSRSYLTRTTVSLRSVTEGGPLDGPKVDTMIVVRIAFACTMLLVLTPACGLLSSRHPASSDSAAPTKVLVEVESHNWSDITVYLLAGGLPQRLGMVSALSSATFDFPSQRLTTSGGVRLRALPVAGKPFTTETILVYPGQVITWTLENHLDASSFSVY